MKMNPTMHEEPVQSLHEIPSNVYESSLTQVVDEGESYEMEYVPAVHDIVTKVSLGKNENIVIKYRLVTIIGGFTYVFKLDKQSEHGYILSFKTLEYGYALTQLTEKDSETLFQKITNLVESAYHDSAGKVNNISILPDNASYTVKDIEICIEEILRKTNKYSEEDLRTHFIGNKIFNVYAEITKQQFESVSSHKVDDMSLRSRYFRMKLLKFLKNWNIEEPYKGSTYFSLKRKQL